MGEEQPPGLSIKEILAWTIIINGVAICFFAGIALVLLLLTAQLAGY